MNSTYGYGLGLDPIHTEANQKHLFPEINLSLGNELSIYLSIYLCGAAYTHVLTHTYAMHYRPDTQGHPRPRQVAPSRWEGRR